MKTYLLPLALVMILNLTAQPVDRSQLREGFLASAQRKTALDSFMVRLGKITSKNPVQECYYGICYALSTQYVSSTWTKIKLVTQSRNILNNAISRDPNDPELRFMRLTVEHYIPSFLGMSKDIPADLAMILAHPDFVADSPPLKKKALEFLIHTKRCNDEQNKVLQQQLADMGKKPQNVLASMQ